MWLKKLFRALDHDLDDGMTRLRARTLGKNGDLKTPAKMGRDDVRIFRGGQLARAIRRTNADDTEQSA